MKQVRLVLSHCRELLWLLLPSISFSFSGKDIPSFFWGYYLPFPLYFQFMGAGCPSATSLPRSKGRKVIQVYTILYFNPCQRDCFKSSHVTQGRPFKGNPGIFFPGISWKELFSFLQPWNQVFKRQRQKDWVSMMSEPLNFLETDSATMLSL